MLNEDAEIKKSSNKASKHNNSLRVQAIVVLSLI